MIQSGGVGNHCRSPFILTKEGKSIQSVITVCVVTSPYLTEMTPLTVFCFRPSHNAIQLRQIQLKVDETAGNSSSNSPHGTAEFFIRHAAVLLFLAPHLSHRLRLEKLKDTLATVLPLHQTLVPLWVDQNVPDEFPQVSATRRCRQTVGHHELNVFLCVHGCSTDMHLHIDKDAK